MNNAHTNLVPTAVQSRGNENQLDTTAMRAELVAARQTIMLLEEENAALRAHIHQLEEPEQ